MQTGRKSSKQVLYRSDKKRQEVRCQSADFCYVRLMFFLHQFHQFNRWRWSARSLFYLYVFFRWRFSRILLKFFDSNNFYPFFWAFSLRCKQKRNINQWWWYEKGLILKWNQMIFFEHFFSSGDKTFFLFCYLFKQI